MAIDIRVVVTDAASLITLAAAQSLDYLLYPDLPLLIPDETRRPETSGAATIRKSATR